MKRVPLKASVHQQPKVPTSIRVPDGLTRAQYDSLENLVMGLGTSKDKLFGTKHVFNELSKQQLEAAYRSDWIARKVVNIPAADATREWRTWQSDNKDIEALEALEKELRLQQKVRLALTRARLYGGAALLIGADAGSMDQPLDTSRVKKGALKFVHVVSRYELNPVEMDWDIESPTYGQPKYWMRSFGPQERIHPTRVVRFVGNELPDPAVGMGWGDSILQTVNDAVLAAGLVAAGGAQIVSELKMDVVKIPDLTASMSNKKYSSLLMDRFALANMTKSLYSVLLLDKEEEWQRISAQMTGLPDTLRMYFLIASGAADIPATRMLGQSPAGLSATGESDLRNYYDNVRSIQTTEQGPAMALLDECLIRSALGTFQPGDIVYDWNPLWQLDEQAEANITAQKATAFKTDVDAGLIPAEVLRDARINQLIEDGVYPGLEQILDAYGPLDRIEEPVADPNVVNQNVAANLNAVNQNVDPNAITDMAKRVRAVVIKKTKPRFDAKPPRFLDATPRSLYVYRKVTNARDILKWAKEQGIPDLEPASELHVTIIYSETPVDWTKVGETWVSEEKDGTMHIPPGGMRMVEKFDGGACVLLFNSAALSWRHCQIKEACGCKVTYPDYAPHITVAYPKTDFDPRKFEPYRGPIELGIEVWSEVNNDRSE